jgi:DNA polymerase-4
MLLERSEGVARELRRQQLTARTIHLKIRTGDFKTWTRSKTLKVGTDLPEVILAAVRELFARRIRLRGKGVRLLGVGVSSFKRAEDGQPSLFPDAVDEKAHRLAAAADALRDRFGENAVTRARLLRKRKGKDDRTPPEASSLPSVD